MEGVKHYTFAFVLMAVSLPLVSYGSTSGPDALSTLGFVLLLCGALVPLYVRYTVTETPSVKDTAAD
jgi:hypothetical protein